jgi:hypothetical protein
MWSNMTIQSFVMIILSGLVIIIFIWSIYSFFMAIFQFVFSKWNPEKIKKAWNWIRYMLLWIIMTVFLLIILPTVLEKLHVPWYEIYTAKNIFAEASNLFSKIITLWQESNTSWAQYYSSPNFDSSTNSVWWNNGGWL